MTRPRLKVGLNLHRLHFFGRDPDAYTAVARKAEELGFESLWVGDHLAFPEEIPPTYPYSPDGRGPHRPDLPWYDAFVSLTHLAAATKNLRLGTDVYILPLRHPFVTARSVATLDLLSRGRVTLGIGVGWLETEFEATGEAFRNRGRRTDEMVQIMRRLWTEDTVEHHGEFYDFAPVKFEPKPDQKPVPIVVGGNSQGALRRAARLCDGWVGVSAALDDIPGTIRRLHEMRAEYGREETPFEITLSPPAPTVEQYRRFYEMGVDRVSATPWPWPEPGPDFTLEEALGSMERFAENVLQNLDV